MHLVPFGSPLLAASISNFRASEQARNSSRLHSVRRKYCRYAIFLGAFVRLTVLERHLSRKVKGKFSGRGPTGMFGLNFKVTCVESRTSISTFGKALDSHFIAIQTQELLSDNTTKMPKCKSLTLRLTL